MNNENKSNVFDVAKYILHKLGTITTFKLQKLCYYSYVWTLVWDENHLFDEKIYAWKNGPVIPQLFDKHKGMFEVSEETFVDADINHISKENRENIDIVLESYSKYTGYDLSQMTHNELPWQNAIKSEDNQILDSDIMEYYTGL